MKSLGQARLWDRPAEPMKTCSPADYFRKGVFHSTHGHVEVTAHDYRCVASLDERAMWLKMCILMYQYLKTFREKFPSNHRWGSSTFAGRKAVVTANKLKASTVHSLQKDMKSMRILDEAPKLILNHYSQIVKNTDLDNVQNGRVLLLAAIGALAMKVAVTIETYVSKPQTSGKDDSRKLNQRVGDVMKGKLATIEDEYRKMLVLALGVSSTTLPEPYYPPEPDSSKQKCKKDDVPSKSAIPVVAHLIGGEESKGLEEVAITQAMILRRLGIDAFPREVQLANLDFLKQDRRYMSQDRL